MDILLSNDDGVYAPGIRELHRVISQVANTRVIAPDRDRSGASSSITISRPLRPRELPDGFISVDGTPADCVYLGLRGLIPEKPRVVISGINHDVNLGDDVLFSGTVAAATQGRMLGIPSIAISIESPCNNFTTAAVVAKNLVEQILRYPLPDNILLNVNVPDVPLNELKGFMVTRLGKRHPDHNLIVEDDPRGKKIYWIGELGIAQDGGLGTDFHAIQNKYVSITPLSSDLTQQAQIDDVQSWIKDADIK